MKKIWLFCFFCLVVSGCNFQYPPLQSQDLSQNLNLPSHQDQILNTEYSQQEELPFLSYAKEITPTDDIIVLQALSDWTFPQDTSINDLSSRLCLPKNRAHEQLPLPTLVAPDLSSYARLKDRWTQDQHYYFIYPEFDQASIMRGTLRQHLPGLYPIASLGEQDSDRFVGYSDGYLISPPYKLVVDKESFVPVSRQEWNPELPSEWTLWRQWARSNGWRFARNAGQQYQRILGYDQAWIYLWESILLWKGEGKEYLCYFINRVKRADDFTLLLDSEIKTLTSTTLPLQSLDIDILLSMNEAQELLMWGWFLLQYQDDNMYIGYKWYARKFPIDGETLERKEYTSPWETLFQNYTLSDKNYHYQLVYYQDGDYYELKRIAK